MFVGDASMSPYEIMQPGGSIEHWNDEAGAVWMQRITQRFQRHAWLNPEPQDRWDYVQSIGIARQLMGERMFPLTLRGLDDAIKALEGLKPSRARASQCASRCASTPHPHLPAGTPCIRPGGSARRRSRRPGRKIRTGHASRGGVSARPQRPAQPSPSAP